VKPRDSFFAASVLVATVLIVVVSRAFDLSRPLTNWINLAVCGVLVLGLPLWRVWKGR
jgi:hypothetical protein